jgi:hypothetical protein
MGNDDVKEPAADAAASVRRPLDELFASRSAWLHVGGVTLGGALVGGALGGFVGAGVGAAFGLGLSLFVELRGRRA